MKIIKKTIIVTLATLVVVVLVIGTMALSVRESNLAEYAWKYDGEACDIDIITFGPCHYSFPCIKYDEKVVGIVLFQHKGHLLLYYPECYKVSYLEPI